MNIEAYGKPRIIRSQGNWCCFAGDVWGFGGTPKEAYWAFIRNRKPAVAGWQQANTLFRSAPTLLIRNYQ